MDQTIQKSTHHMSTVICLTASLLVVLRMITGSQLFLLLFLVLVSMGIVIDKIENKILYILYFVPWAYAIKFSLGQPSLVTVLSAIYCVICLIYIILHKLSVSIFYLSIILIIFMYSFFTLLFGSNATIVEILSFLLNFVVIYFAILFVKRKDIIPSYILFHALGLAVSGGVNLLGNYIPAIENYITSYTIYHTVNTTNVLYTRFTGLDMDPNYFSIQALIAIACLCVIIFSSNLTLNRFQKITAYIYISILSIMGVLTLSKMFLISFAVFIVTALVLLLKDNFKKGMYYLIFISSAVGILLSTFYDYFYEAFLFRFLHEGTNAASITTGRSDIWLEYYYEITGNAQIMFLGNGISSSFLNDHISHNMYLIAWYYLGIVGITLFLILFIALYSQLKINLSQTTSFSPWNIYIIPLVIAILANFSLDSFIMDYFGVHVFFILLMLVLNEKKELMNISYATVET